MNSPHSPLSPLERIPNLRNFLTGDILEFADLVHLQVDLLNTGEPLLALDYFFSKLGTMHSNGVLFARDGAEAREKQQPYFSLAIEIHGNITDLHIDDAREVCVFRNRTSFTTRDGKVHKIDGLCWQQWNAGKVHLEHYWDGSHMRDVLEQGILRDPSLLLKHTE